MNVPYDTEDPGGLIEYAYHHPSSRAAVRDLLTQRGNQVLDAIENALRDLPDDTMKEVLLQRFRGLQRLRLCRCSPASHATQIAIACVCGQFKPCVHSATKRASRL